jgi:hypothetical protein
MIGGCIFNKGLSVDCAGEMHMQIRPLGHLRKKGPELKRIMFSNIKGTSGFLLRDPGVRSCMLDGIGRASRVNSRS